MDKSEYHKYLASREWALLKEQTKSRSRGKCERCTTGTHDATHHISYEHLGNETIDDLLGVCEACHKYLSGKSSFDPADWSFLRSNGLGLSITGMQFMKFIINLRNEFKKRGMPIDRLDNIGNEIWSLLEMLHCSEYMEMDCFKELVYRQMDQVEALLSEIKNKEE
jgi:hypothetical protein